MIKRYSNSHFHPVDYVLSGYAFLIGLLLIPFHRDVAGWQILSVAYITLGFLILETVRAVSGSPRIVSRGVRIGYIAVAMGLYWVGMNWAVRMIFPFYGSSLILRLDQWIFGGYPTVMAMRYFTPLNTEVMHFFYAAYYLFFPILIVWAFMQDKERGALDFAFYVCFVHVVFYVFYILFPVEGPKTLLQALHTQPHIGGGFFGIVRYIQSNASVLGAAFPSAHVAGVLVMSLFAGERNRTLSAVLALFAFGIAMATVYCQYHHAVDGMASLLLSYPLYYAGKRMLGAWNRHVFSSSP